MAEDFLAKLVAGIKTGLDGIDAESMLKLATPPPASFAKHLVEYAVGGGAPTAQEEAAFGKMPSTELMQLRDKFAGDKAYNIRISPFEHRAFTRETVLDAATPLEVLDSTLGMSARIPSYYLAKATGIHELAIKPLTGETGYTTPASISQMVEGFRGIGEGLLGRIQQGK